MEEALILSVTLLGPSAKYPSKAYQNDAGFDLFSPSDHVIPPNNLEKIDLRFKIKLPPGCYGRIAPRSSLAMQKINVFGGVIDPGYTGPVSVILFNHGTNDYKIQAGERVAQLICESFVSPLIPIDNAGCEWDQEVAKKLEENRDDKGFGSSD